MKSYLPPQPGQLAELKLLLETIGDLKKAKAMLADIEEATKEFFDKSEELSLREDALLKNEAAASNSKLSAESSEKEAKELLVKAKQKFQAAEEILKDAERQAKLQKQENEKLGKEFAVKSEELKATLELAANIKKEAEQREFQAASLKAEYDNKLSKLKAMVG
jgi:hypothetical protein